MPELSFYNDKWVVRKRFCTMGVCVPKGFSTDLTSTPRVLWSIYPPFGKYQRGAIVHDYLYKNKYPRKHADKIFKKIMELDNVGFLTRNIFYITVRLLGWLRY